MKAIAALPNAYVKISMLVYGVPGWIQNESRTAFMRDLVRETVALFGPNRCMVATNWWKNAAISDSDGLSDVGPDPVQLLTFLAGFLSDYSEEDRNRKFCGTAREFYRIE
jgi:predicted TIM-barrel fold metal-dependent hydrolase